MLALVGTEDLDREHITKRRDQNFYLSVFATTTPHRYWEFDLVSMNWCSSLESKHNNGKVKK